jgi:hypothetical protein
MVEQFSAAEAAVASEKRDWQKIRRAAVSKRMKAPTLPSPEAEGIIRGGKNLSISRWSR